MATIKQGILGGFSGKIGGIVGSSWKGINVMKARPVSVANPRTAAQVAQRDRFGNVVAFAAGLLASVVKPLWDRFASQQSGFNAFISRNIALFDAALPDPPANLVISSGKMASTAIDMIGAANGNPDVDVTWTNDAGAGYKLASDEAYVVVINEDTGSVAASSAAAIRSAGTATVTMPEACSTSDVLRAYLAFRRADGTIASNTAYATDTV